MAKTIKAGDMIVVRWRVQRAPWRSGNAYPDLCTHRQGLGASVGLVADGRFSGGTWVEWSATRCRKPTKALRALVKDDDSITIDANKPLVQLNVSAKELARPKNSGKAPKPRYTTR